MGRNFDVTASLQNNSNLKRPGVANFANTIKIFKQFLNLMKIKIITNYLSKCYFCIYLAMQQKLLVSGEKYCCQQNARAVSRDLYIFVSPLGKV